MEIKDLEIQNQVIQSHGDSKSVDSKELSLPNYRTL